MTFSISEFKSYRDELGILRSHSYEVDFSFPGFTAGVAPQINADLRPIRQTLRFSVDSCNFPATGIDVYNVQYYGYGVIEKHPTIPNYAPFQCTFVVDQFSRLPIYMTEWIRGIVNITGDDNPQMGLDAYEISYFEDYVTSINLYIYNPYGDLVRNVLFRNAYPVTMGDVQLSWGRLNENVKLPVVFTYVDWIDVPLGGFD